MKSQPTPRRRRKTAAARLRPFWLLLVLFVLVGAMGWYAFITWHALWPQTIVVNGNHVVTKDQIFDAAKINLRKNIWLQHIGEIDQRIETIPYIERAVIHRRPPGQMIIDVTERRPFAQLKAANGEYVVDVRLRILQDDDARFDRLPIFLAPEIRDIKVGETRNTMQLIALRDDTQALMRAGLDATLLEHDKYGDLIVTLRNGVRVLFGDEADVEKKIPLVEPILTQVGKRGKEIATIDLRAVGTPVVVYKK